MSEPGGALVMLAFGAGTLPVMAMVATLARRIVPFRRLAGIVVLAFGIHQTTLAFATFDPSLGGTARCHATAER